MQFSSAVTDLAIFNLSFRLGCEQPLRIFIIDDGVSYKNRRNSNEASKKKMRMQLVQTISELKTFIESINI